MRASRRQVSLAQWVLSGELGCQKPPGSEWTCQAETKPQGKGAKSIDKGNSSLQGSSWDGSQNSLPLLPWGPSTILEDGNSIFTGERVHWLLEFLHSFKCVPRFESPAVTRPLAAGAWLWSLATWAEASRFHSCFYTLHLQEKYICNGEAARLVYNDDAVLRTEGT